MDRLIYTAMTGASAAAQRQAVLSNNLANVSTNGFRAELSTFRAVPVRGDGATTRVMAVEATAGHLDTPGAAQRTGRSLDAMTTGNSWFAVQALDGTESYTRNGSFEVSPEGTLLTGNGLVVLDDGGAPITVPTGGGGLVGWGWGPPPTPPPPGLVSRSAPTPPPPPPRRATSRPPASDA
jgi:flagellar basal-body rod protein FlgF